MDGLLSLASPHELAARWRRLRDTQPDVSVALGAARLDVSEAELVAACCGDGALRLDGPFGDLVRALPTLGTMRAVTRNPLADIETRGRHPAPDAGCAGAVGEIGARYFLEQWCYGYLVDDGVVDEDTSLRFYDGRGDAVHELYVETATDRTALARLVDFYACFDQCPGETITIAANATNRASGWLRRADRARPVAPRAIGDVLPVVLADGVPVSIAVRSRGVVQRFSGRLDAVETIGPRLVVTAPHVRVRLCVERVAEAWVVHAPSLDGPSTSLELLDARAGVVCSLSGARFPGEPEPRRWHDLVDDVRTLV